MVISIMSSVASVCTGEAKSVVSVCQLLTDIRRRRPLNQTLYEVGSRVDCGSSSLFCFSLLLTSSPVSFTFFFYTAQGICDICLFSFGRYIEIIVIYM